MPLIRDGLISTNRTIKENMNSSRPLKNVNILEVGCGAGILTEVITLHNNKKKKKFKENESILLNIDRCRHWQGLKQMLLA